MIVYDKHEINWGQGYVTVSPPQNWKGIMPQVVFAARINKPQLSLGQLVWVEDNAVKLNAYFKAGTTTGKGIGVGLPYRITDPVGTIIFDGVIDLSDKSTLMECDMVHAPIKAYGIDWFNDASSAITWKSLKDLPVNAPGRIIPSIHYKRVPYTQSDLPNYTQAHSLEIMDAEIAIKIAETIFKIAEISTKTTADTVMAATTLGAASAPAISDPVIMVLYIIEVVALLIALIDLVIKTIHQYIQPKKFKLAMKEADLFTLGCASLGLTFCSTIYGVNSPDGYNGEFKDMTHMPAKSMMFDATNNPLNPFKRPPDEADNFPNNPNVYGYPDQQQFNFKNYCQSKMKQYNAEIVIVGNKLYFEEKHFWNNTNPFQIPNTGPPGWNFNNPAPYGTNLQDLPRCMYLAFQIDQSEQNTFRQYRGTSVEVTIKENNPGPPKDVVWGKGEQRMFDTALAKGKWHLTEIEAKLNVIIQAVFGFINIVISGLNSFITLINNIISIFGGSSNTIPSIPSLNTGLITARFGWMELSNDSFGVPKSFVGQDVNGEWKVHPMSQVWCSAANFLSRLHGKDLPTRGAQAYTYRKHIFKLCASEFKQILNSNVLRTPDNLWGKFEVMDWDRHNEQAINVDYLVFKPFLLNLTEQITIDGV